jgi:hypothetical protein
MEKSLTGSPTAATRTRWTTTLPFNGVMVATRRTDMKEDDAKVGAHRDPQVLS